MANRLQSRLGVLFAMLCFAGCGTLPTPASTLPLSPVACTQVFPSHWEINAALRLSRGAVAENFLLALATPGSTPELALLTPQGIPLYRFACSQEEWSVSRQARLDLLVEPERLIAWLQLIYLDEARVSAVLRPGWDWLEEGSRREFQRPGSGAGSRQSIIIERIGSGPWYESASLVDNGLEDSGLETQLVIRILEASRVLPE
jgi:hypothetical protein